jgi:hypothetical protein
VRRLSTVLERCPDPRQGRPLGRGGREGHRDVGGGAHRRVDDAALLLQRRTVDHHDIEAGGVDDAGQVPMRPRCRQGENRDLPRTIFRPTGPEHVLLPLPPLRFVIATTRSSGLDRASGDVEQPCPAGYCAQYCSTSVPTAMRGGGPTGADRSGRCMRGDVLTARQLDIPQRRIGRGVSRAATSANPASRSPSWGPRRRRRCALPSRLHDRRPPGITVPW